MDTQTLVTIIAIVIANIGTTIGLFTWATNHSSEDIKETRRISDENARESRRILEAIHQEMKDFHGRLISIEERTKG